MMLIHESLVLELRIEMNVYDHRSSEQGFEPRPLQCRYSALPAPQSSGSELPSTGLDFSGLSCVCLSCAKKTVGIIHMVIHFANSSALWRTEKKSGAWKLVTKPPIFDCARHFCFAFPESCADKIKTRLQKH